MGAHASTDVQPVQFAGVETVMALYVAFKGGQQRQHRPYHQYSFQVLVSVKNDGRENSHEKKVNGVTAYGYGPSFYRYGLGIEQLQKAERQPYQCGKGKPVARSFPSYLFIAHSQKEHEQVEHNKAVHQYSALYGREITYYAHYEIVHDKQQRECPIWVLYGEKYSVKQKRYA